MGNMGMGFPSDGVDNQGWKLYITSMVMVIAAGLCVIARCATRLHMSRFGWDDATIVTSLAFSIVLSVAIQLAVVNGYGMHKADLSKNDLETALRLFFIAQTPYKITVCLNKVSIILLYLRIFVSKSFRIAAFVVMGIVVAWSIGGVAATIFQCVPIQGSWDKKIEAKCIDKGMFWIAYAVMNILTDVMVLALPIRPILMLKLSLRDRLLLCGIFLLGLFVTGTSILRTTSVEDSLKNQADITWNFIERGVWTLIEANLGIINACLPVLKQPLGRLFPRLFGTTQKSSTYDNAADYRNKERRYSLSGESGKKSKVWQGPSRNRQIVSITGQSRTSDEEHIVRDWTTDNSNVELENYTSSGKSGIEKRVELVRTSFHEDAR